MLAEKLRFRHIRGRDAQATIKRSERTDGYIKIVTLNYMRS